MASPKLPKRAQNLISAAVDKLYDSLKVKFLGPTVQTKKTIGYKYTHEKTLPGMFEAANVEEGVKPNLNTLDALMRVAEGYIDANRERTKAKVLKEVMGTLQDAANARVVTNLETVLNGKLIDVLGEAQTNIEAIINTEVNAAKNLGVLDGVVAVNNAAGVEDPVVYFLIAKRIHPDAPCPECVRLHCTFGEGSPPRLWRLSEVSHGYHKKGEDFPAIGGLHPNCRCTMVTLLPGYGFAGTDSVRFIAPGHDELKLQRGEQ
jgi:hypothetical protein